MTILRAGQAPHPAAANFSPIANPSDTSVSVATTIWIPAQTVARTVGAVRVGLVCIGALTTLYLPEWAQWVIVGLVAIVLSLYVFSYSDA